MFYGVWKMNKKENCFDFLRLFAALTVVISHSVNHLGIRFLWFTKENNLWFFDGVPLFFILSGFLVYRSCERCMGERGSPKSFFRNRALRIVPAIYAYLIVVTIYLFTIKIVNFNSFSNKGFIAWFFSNVFLVPVYYPEIFRHFGVGVLNGSLWTIPAEVSFYLIVPVLYLISKKIKFKGMSVLLLAITLFGTVSYGVLLKASPESVITKLYGVTFLPYLIYFGLGVVYTKVWNKIPDKVYLFICSFIMYIVIRNNILIDFQKYLGMIYIYFWAVPFSYCVIWFGYNGAPIFNKITTTIGDLSYGVYIWHMVVVNSFIYFNFKNKLSFLPSTLIIVLVCFIAIIMAALSWNFIEKPSLKRKTNNSNVKIISQPIYSE